MPKRNKKPVIDFVVYILFILTITIALIPIAWILVTSIKKTMDIFAYPPVIIPKAPAFDNYIKVFKLTEIGKHFLNSILTATLSTTAVLLLSLLLAYGFSRFTFKRKALIMILLLGTQMIPAVTNIIPLYITMLKLGLLDTITALFLVYTAVNVPFSVWIIKSYIDSVPDSMDEAAIMDGAGRLRIIFSVILPVALPGIAAAGLFSFIACWNEFYVALVLTSTIRSKTIPLGLFNFQASYDIQWNLLCAASVAALLPIVLLFILLQDKFISGLTSGAYKG